MGVLARGDHNESCHTQYITIHQQDEEDEVHYSTELRYVQYINFSFFLSLFILTKTCSGFM